MEEQNKLDKENQEKIIDFKETFKDLIEEPKPELSQEDAIRQYKDEVTLIAHTLLEHEQITAEEIDYLLEYGHLKRDEAKLEEAKKDEAKEEVVEKPVKKPATKKPAATKKAPSKKVSSKEEK